MVSGIVDHRVLRTHRPNDAGHVLFKNPFGSDFGRKVFYLMNNKHILLECKRQTEGSRLVNGLRWTERKREDFN